MTVVPPTKLWIAFVLGWLVPLGATGVLLAQRIAGPRLVAALAGLALLGALYLYVTLREALAPDSAGVRRRSCSWRRCP